MRNIFLTTILSISMFAMTGNAWSETYTYDNGDKYVGEHKDDIKHGQGTYTHADGAIERGYFMNDEYVPDICEGMSLTKGTDPFGQCVVELIKEIRDDD
jgi:hypothetical protein